MKWRSKESMLTPNAPAASLRVSSRRGTCSIGRRERAALGVARRGTGEPPLEPPSGSARFR